MVSLAGDEDGWPAAGRAPGFSMSGAGAASFTLVNISRFPFPEGLTPGVGTRLCGESGGGIAPRFPEKRTFIFFRGARYIFASTRHKRVILASTMSNAILSASVSPPGFCVSRRPSTSHRCYRARRPLSVVPRAATDDDTPNDSVVEPTSDPVITDNVPKKQKGLGKGVNLFDPAATASRFITRRFGFTGGLVFVGLLASVEGREIVGALLEKDEDVVNGVETTTGTYCAFPKSWHDVLPLTLVTVCPYIAQHGTDTFLYNLSALAERPFRREESEGGVYRVHLPRKTKTSSTRPVHQKGVGNAAETNLKRDGLSRAYRAFPKSRDSLFCRLGSP